MVGVGGDFFERLPDVVCSAGVVRLRQGYGVTASAFYGAAPHKKIQLGSPKGLPSRSFSPKKRRLEARGVEPLSWTLLTQASPCSGADENTTQGQLCAGQV